MQEFQHEKNVDRNADRKPLLTLDSPGTKLYTSLACVSLLAMQEALCQALWFPNMLMCGRSCLLRTFFRSFPGGNTLLGEGNCLFLTNQDIMAFYLLD